MLRSLVSVLLQLLNIFPVFERSFSLHLTRSLIYHDANPSGIETDETLRELKDSLIK